MLSKLISVDGAPRYMRSDNGPEFVSAALLKWVVSGKIESALIDPGKPWQNGTNESFNGKFRDECLAMEWFRNRTEAKIVIDDWRRHYDEGSTAFEPELRHADGVPPALRKQFNPSRYC